VHGRFPSNQIDHVNHVRSDNRLVNLREFTLFQNAQNAGMLTNSNSGVKGVYIDERANGWRAKLEYTIDGVITVESKRCHSFEEACEWRRQFEIELASSFLPTF